MEHEPTDEKLAQMAVTNKAFFAVLIGRYEAKLLRYILRRTNVDRKDAEDLLQEIFIKIYLNINGFNPSMKFSSWAYRIAHNQIISDYRKRVVRGEVSMEDMDEEVIARIASDIDVEEEFTQRENKDVILNAINQLPEKYKDILILRFFEDQDYDAISDILKVPPGTVAARISRGKEKLKELLVQSYE